MKPRTLPWIPAALALLSMGCSDPAPNPATVGLTLSVGPPAIPQSGSACNTPGVTKNIGNPAPTPTNPGGRVTDGESNVEVSCRVRGKNTFSVSASIKQGPVGFSIAGGSVDAATGMGTFNATLNTPETFGLSGSEPCTFDVSDAPLEVKSGTIYARFDCPLMTAAPSTACGASGTLVLEFCEE